MFIFRSEQWGEGGKNTGEWSSKVGIRTEKKSRKKEEKNNSVPEDTSITRSTADLTKRPCQQNAPNDEHYFTLRSFREN